MQRLEVSCAVRPLYGSLGVKGLMEKYHPSDGISTDPKHTPFFMLQLHELSYKT